MENDQRPPCDSSGPMCIRGQCQEMELGTQVKLVGKGP